jgi:uncharacterized membrane protein YeaQ/YmgE (transglycosylase-associated protein family)
MEEKMDIGGTISSIIAAPLICIGWIIVGAIAGALANSFMKTNQPLIADIILGLLGALIGGFILSLLGVSRPEGGLTGVIASLVVATLGAVILIAIVRALRGQRVA